MPLSEGASWTSLSILAIGLVSFGICAWYAVRVRRQQALEAAYQRMISMGESGQREHKKFFDRIQVERMIAGYAEGENIELQSGGRAEGMSALNASSACCSGIIVDRLVAMDMTPVLWASSSNSSVKIVTNIAATWACVCFIANIFLWGFPLSKDLTITILIFNLFSTLIAALWASWLLSTVYVLTPGFAVRIRTLGIYTQVLKMPWGKMSKPRVETTKTGSGSVFFGGEWHMEDVIGADAAHLILQENGAGPTHDEPFNPSTVAMRVLGPREDGDVVDESPEPPKKNWVLERRKERAATAATVDEGDANRAAAERAPQPIADAHTATIDGML